MRVKRIISTHDLPVMLPHLIFMHNY